ncbi:helix-turn-helix domain-containing protein [Phaeocystidibacter luteus]|uniref:Helix-turn-helix transcriptional regulator n=1 Tax=Phaeocystidibacter luteus TaxID=911197 RepID=A0A6N6RCY6_9FLAO|nr:response regulator transcription factor [Phaeocystidibacter luteus]KAB2805466.1 helix-turn-helix transcriptional regulator [Phaeocystidibacter luteus]
MSEEVIRIKSISQMHELVGAPKPNHPLISVVLNEDMGEYKSIPAGTSLSMNLYQIWLKGGHCGVQYGRKHYDFEEGVMTFTPPNQVMTMTEDTAVDGDGGWGIFFHPDLIRTSPLGENIDAYSFFNYESHEALHLSDKEKKTLRDCVDNIIEEITDRIDDHSQRVIVSNLELLLNYCARYYDRQFNTRTTAHKAIVTQVDAILKKYIDEGELSMNGQPSVNVLAERVHLSANYLSDLLKKETGRSAKDHINEFLIGRAKRALLTSQDSISEIAYELGFNYPHYFSRLFKAKTGLTPNEFRMQN